MLKDGRIEVLVESIRVKGSGAIILTGPSSCGKGEVANQLRKFLSIPEELHFSMGNILRTTIDKARTDSDFRELLSATYSISDDKPPYQPGVESPISEEKFEKYRDRIVAYFHKKEISQLDWLEFCVNNGLLIPDNWTVNIINAVFGSTVGLNDKIFIIDGYPRTETAARELLDTFERFDIPLLKIIHLSITKNEMKKRASLRNRTDDTDEGLERRYRFYIENVQPSIDYMKVRVGADKVKLIDAHQAVWVDGKLDLDTSIKNVVYSVVRALDLPSYILELK